MTPAVEVAGLSKRFGRGERAVPALDGLSLAIPAGGIFGLLGANGAGKSTLMRIVAGPVLPAFLLSLAAATLEALLDLRGDALAMLPLPTLAADAVRAALFAWSAAAYAAAFTWFRRQDLAAERDRCCLAGAGPLGASPCIPPPTP
ncbi:MAG TPA: ATP-binding cassette domain-containing protein [Allosphingosinicella sp.]